MNKDQYFSIRAPARIHTALLNESGYLNRIDGSIGFVVDRPYWDITISADKSCMNLSHLDSELVPRLLETVAIFEIQFKLQIGVSISGEIPIHSGLGSKTSLLMGVGNAISELFNLNLHPPEIAAIVKRGGTSGLGIWAGSKRGFLWDAGRQYPNQKSTFSPSSTSIAKAPKLISNISIGEFSICHFRFTDRGISGISEQSVFTNNCPLPENEAIEALAIVGGGILPALLEKDIVNIQAPLRSLQRIGLKKIEWDLQSSVTKEFRSYWEKCVPDITLCLSSMGPTLYCLTDRPDFIKYIVENFYADPFHFIITS
ncbi:hypothetical protein GJ697_02945 [Pseudoduganella sp. FT25W]|uniref:GHMP kinase N-terminal domain-containing protein n=1 Tax=Duganella alba TaxID=2666081 RepID=A0A6L5QAP2_9BURK|nr:beta-ribofuranosylaminobenzene 5'-phosphate synthase family protein [Duganella alba]MRX06785.1 hypothetical protein [Duganella alba]MRX18413.1 hypothetical protein [Duganella alba]